MIIIRNLIDSILRDGKWDTQYLEIKEHSNSEYDSDGQANREYDAYQYENGWWRKWTISLKKHCSQPGYKYDSRY